MKSDVVLTKVVRLLYSVIALILLSVAATTIWAQDFHPRPPAREGREGRPMPPPMPPGVPVGGTVSSVTGTTIQILSGAITIDAANARIFSPVPGQPPGEGTKLELSAITPGMHIMSFIDEANAGSVLSAKEIIVRPEPPPDAEDRRPRFAKDDPRADFENPKRAHLGGPIQCIDAAQSTMTILNQQILINSETKFFSRELQSISDLKTGQPVFVNVENINGRLTAVVVGTPHHRPGPPPMGD